MGGHKKIKKGEKRTRKMKGYRRNYKKERLRTK